MIAADSALIAHSVGRKGRRRRKVLDQALSDHLLVLPPVVLVELLSDPKLPSSVSELLRVLPLLETSDGYWERQYAARQSTVQR